MKQKQIKILIGFLLVWAGLSSFGQGENIFIEVKFDNSTFVESYENLTFTPEGVTPKYYSYNGTLTSQYIPVSLKSVKSFITVSFSATGKGFNQDKIRFYLRKNDIKGWSEWRKIKHAHEVTPQDLTYASELLFFDIFCKQLQFKVVLSGDQKQIPSLETMKINLFTPNGENRATKQSDQKDNFVNDCYCPLPDFLNRNEWNCPDGLEPSCSSPIYTDISHLVVHHSASSNTSNNWPAVVLSFWDYHVNTLGWCDIGYNWLVDPEGNLYEGRGGGNNVQGAHFSCANSNTMGICVIGNFMDVEPTQEAKEMLIRLLSWKCCQNELSPSDLVYHSSTELTLPSVCGHRDSNPSLAPNACPSGTACPGDVFYPQLNDVRFAIDSLMNMPNCGGSSPPINDNCESAQLLEYQPECEFLVADVSGATPGGLDEPDCSEYYGFPALEDVWFTFVADTNAMGIKVQGSEMFDPVLALYSDCMEDELACSDFGGGVGGMEFIDYHNFEIGETYYIRVYHYGQLSPLTTNFEICLTQPFEYPVADFSASVVQGSPPLSVDFFDLSSNAPTSWNWTFEGGMPQTSTVQNPSGIVYEESGLFDVSLWVSNENGENEIVKEEFIEVDVSGINATNDYQVEIFPNPTTGKVYITSDQKLNSVLIINHFGHTILHLDQPSKFVMADLSGYMDGLYFVVVNIGKEVVRFKLLKQ